MMRVLGILAAAALVWGCAPQGQGGGVRFASIDRPLSRDFIQLAKIERDLVEVNASGRTVRAPAPSGYCFPRDGVMTSDASAFLLLQRCKSDPAGAVISISVSKHGLFGDQGPTEENFSAFQAYLETEEGARQLGLDAGSGAIFLIETSYRDGALYALAQDASNVGLSFSGDYISRAFTEVNGRMAVVSMITAKGDNRKPDELFFELQSVVDLMRKANLAAGA